LREIRIRISPGSPPEWKIELSVGGRGIADSNTFRLFTGNPLIGLDSGGGTAPVAAFPFGEGGPKSASTQNTRTESRVPVPTLADIEKDQERDFQVAEAAATDERLAAALP
jgi:hypothetical protein